MVEWCYKLLTHRNLKKLMKVTTKMGFPRGGVCTANFLVIAFDEAAKILISNRVTRELFTDDGNGLLGGIDI